MSGAGGGGGARSGGGGGAGVVRLAALLLAALSLSGRADAFSHREQAYKVYMSPWSHCQALPDEDPEPRYYQDRAADKAGASSRHVGHLRDFRHLDVGAGRAATPARTLVHTPRLGFQRRAVECRDYAGRVTNVENCGQVFQSTATARTCVMRTDCVLGEWSAWRARPGGGYTRTRSVLALPQGGGTECGVVEEVKPLAPEAGAHWAPGTWGPCHVAGVTAQPTPRADPAAASPVLQDVLASGASGGSVASGPCGGGAQRREVTCVRGDGRALHPAHCSALPSPPLQQPCEVACPRDCAVGNWGEWSPCRPLGGCPMYPVQELTTAGYSVRRRRVLTAASANGAPCPALQETRACSTPRCAAWRADSWSACTLFVPEDGCGPGLRTRELRCLDHDHKEAPHSWCARGGGAGANWARSEHCFIACPGDCVLSAWSAWGACSAACTSPSRAPPTRTRRRHILAHSAKEEEGAYQCPDERRLVQTEPCNMHSCSTHAWLALPWGPCKTPDRESTSSDDTNILDSTSVLKDGEVEATSCLVVGEKTREVSCVQDNDRIVKDSLCAPLVKPVGRRGCSLPCPRACSTGPWSDWSPCPNTCEPAIQSRERAVRGGEGCGERQERRVCTPPRSCHPALPGAAAGGRAAWAAGPWGSCRLPPPLVCGFGRKVRGVWCSVESHRVDASACAGLNAPPLAEMHCRLPCDTDAPNTNLTNYSPCHEVCRRSGIMATADWSLKCFCPNIHVELLPAESDCILPEGASCGVGRKLKSALCMDTAERSVLPMDICKKYNNLTTNRFVLLPDYTHDEEFPGLLQRACVVACPRDCAAGPWTEWGPCVVEEDSLAAFRIRTRAVLYAAENGGRECGPTLQRAACSRRELVWHATDWDVCTPTEAPCGHALQNRTVSCILLDSGVEVEENACGVARKPPSQADCDAPCPADCVVSQWSDWSPCEQYKTGGRRDRTRVVLRSPAPEGAACPHLVEAEPCTSRTYTWFIAPWDDCQPLGGSPCGEGTKRRIVRCMRDDGLFVNDSLCPNVTATEARVSWCYVPCGADCELTDWSPWDSSVCTCGVGRQYRGQFMTRRRRRVSGAAWPGRACGAEEQRAPCPRTLCMKSIATPQIECQAEEPQYPEDTSPMYSRPRLCGHGVLETAVTCVPYEPGDTLEADRKVEPPRGVRYELSRCAVALPGRIVSAPLKSLREPCTVECGCSGAAGAEGELGEWSAWGPCRGGARSRARHRTLRPRPRCPQPDKFVTIEWANCTEGQASQTSAPQQTSAPSTKAQDTYWFGYATPEPELEPHVTISRFRMETSLTVSLAMWVVAGIILLYALYAPYSAIVRYRLNKKEKGVNQV